LDLGSLNHMKLTELDSLQLGDFTSLYEFVYVEQRRIHQIKLIEQHANNKHNRHTNKRILSRRPSVISSTTNLLGNGVVCVVVYVDYYHLF
jgi:hypothetical protein